MVQALRANSEADDSLNAGCTHGTHRPIGCGALCHTRVRPPNPQQNAEQHLLLTERRAGKTCRSAPGGNTARMAERWRKLLFASDFEDAATSAVDEVIPLAKALGAHVALTHVQSSALKSWGSSRLEERHRAERLELLADRLRRQGVPASARLSTEPNVAAALVAMAKLESADAILLGPSQPGQLLRGSTVESVVKVAEHPVWVCRNQALPRHILCGVDGSVSCAQALVLATKLRDSLGARLSVVHAVGNPDFNPLGMAPQEEARRTEEHRERSAEAMRRFVAAAGVTDVEVRCIWGRPAAVLLAVAQEEEVDLTVVGRTATKGLKRMVVGSTAEDILQNCTGSVLLLGERT